jgi:Putative peptidoglycan binding domain
VTNEYYTSGVLLNRGDVDEAGAANYPRKSQDTPGRLVFELQSDLRALGYLLAAPDGAFGEGTERAVRQCGGINDEVNNWSAGCQIIKGGLKGPQWRRFDQLIDDVASTEQKHFSYALIRGESLTD